MIEKKDRHLIVITLLLICLLVIPLSIRADSLTNEIKNIMTIKIVQDSVSVRIKTDTSPRFSGGVSINLTDEIRTLLDTLVKKDAGKKVSALDNNSTSRNTGVSTAETIMLAAETRAEEIRTAGNFTKKDTQGGNSKDKDTPLWILKIIALIENNTRNYNLYNRSVALLKINDVVVSQRVFLSGINAGDSLKEDGTSRAYVVMLKSIEKTSYAIIDSFLT